VRDYLDIAALSDLLGIKNAAADLQDIDSYYADIYEGEGRIATQLVRQLSNPQPRDTKTINELHTYKQLDERWHQWSTVVSMLQRVAQEIVEGQS
jgi:hypothetical protein